MTTDIKLAPHPPARATFDYRVRLTWNTAAYLGDKVDNHNLEEIIAAHLRFLWASDPTIECEVISSSVERRFEVLWDELQWRVWDNATEDYIASFDRQSHADHYADALERKPDLVDD